MADKEGGAGPSEAEEHFHMFFYKIPDAIIIIDQKGTLLEANEMAEKISGYNRSELLGRNVITDLGILDNKTKLLVIKKLALHFSGNKIPPFEIEIRKGDGNKVPVEINPQIIDYKGKKADIVSLRDITERKKMEEEQKKAEETLKKRAEELEKFNKLSVGRELKMVELKKRIDELEKQLKMKSNQKQRI